MIGKMLLAVGTMLASTAAQAQYAPYPPQPGPSLAYGEVPPDYRVFTGVRAEAHISYDRLRADLGDDDSDRLTADGFGYGGEIGFDLPVGGIVLGAYAGVDGSTVRRCAVDDGTTACLRMGRSFTAGGRIGVPIGTSVLLYAKGGYTNGQIRLTATDPQTPAANFTFRQNQNGYHVGGGVEAALSSRTYGKLEYVYTQLRAPRNDADDLPVDFNRQQVQAGFGVRF